MERENQIIEEMTRVYDEARYRAQETLGSMNEGAGVWYARAFYNAGYRKERQGEWISVEDRLPKPHETVLVYSRLGCITTDMYCYDGIWLEHRFFKVTHWMPLPTPPKMKGAE